MVGWIVACACVAAGVGVVGFDPPPEEATVATTRTSREIRAIAPRVVEVTFNPRTQRGLKIAKVAFRFTYRTDPARRELARERIQSEWDRLVSHSLEVLMQRTPRELKDPVGLETVGRELCRALDEVLFADGSGRSEEILWKQVIVQ